MHSEVSTCTVGSDNNTTFQSDANDAATNKKNYTDLPTFTAGSELLTHVIISGYGWIMKFTLFFHVKYRAKVAITGNTHNFLCEKLVRGIFERTKTKLAKSAKKYRDAPRGFVSNHKLTILHFTSESFRGLELLPHA